MAWKRFYTERAHNLMIKVRKLIMILLSPLWLPIYLLVKIGYKAEDLLNFLDDVLQKILDKFIPQIK